MSLEEFFSMEEKNIIDYDFADEIIKNSNISDKYLNLKSEYLDKNTDTIRKYILYKTTFSYCDPDTNEGTLKDIYRKIWNLEATETIFSDTMTSAQNIIAGFYTNVCRDEWEKYKNNYNKENKNKIKYFSKSILEDLYKNKDQYKEFKHYFIDKNDDSKIILDFLRHYHSLGNYIIVPYGFNSARSGSFASHDMWDITLMKIKQYYDSLVSTKLELREDEKNMLELLHFDCVFYNTKKWLDSFKTFKNFIDKNYLQSYVYKINDSDKYEIKSCFTKVHNFSNPKISSDKKDYLEYIEEITNAIKQRTKQIKDGYK